VVLLAAAEAGGIRGRVIWQCIQLGLTFKAYLKAAAS